MRIAVVWVLHRLPDIWGDAQVFRPECRDQVNGQKVPQWAYFSPGGGSRICIGMSLAQLEIWLMLATILQRYTPRLLPGHPVVPLPLITLRVKHGLHAKLEPTPQLWESGGELLQQDPIGECNTERSNT